MCIRDSVSTEEQNTARQEVLLRELGVDEVFIDKASGKNADRPEITRMMNYVRRGDTVIVESVSYTHLWKTTREFLLDQGFTELNSPKSTMRKAFSYGLIDDEQAWIALLNARNQTSHIYDDATAQEIYSQIESEFVSLFDKLIEQLKRG